MNLQIFLDGAALLLFIVLVVRAFTSKTIVYGRMLGGKPQEINLHGRIFLLVVGSVGAYQFGLAFLKQLYPQIDFSWLQRGLPLSEVVLFILFLFLSIPVLIRIFVGLWLKRREQGGLERVISIFMAVIILYLIWEATPTIFGKVVSLFRLHA